MEIMEGFVRFWRVLLRFFLGFMFILIIISILFWTEIVTHNKVVIDLIITKSDLNIIQSLTSSLFVLLILILISSLGIFLLEIISVNFHLLLCFVLKWQLLFMLVYRFSIISNLLLPIAPLAKKIYTDRSQEFYNYYLLKNWARVGQDTHYFEKLDSHLKNIYNHIKDIKNPDTIEHIDYYSSVNQEQVKRDRLRDEIRDIYYLMIVLFSILVLVVIRKLLHLDIFIPAFLILEILLIPSVSYKRFHLAIYIITGYIDNFTIGEGASVEDRDAI